MSGPSLGLVSDFITRCSLHVPGPLPDAFHHAGLIGRVSPHRPPFSRLSAPDRARPHIPRFHLLPINPQLFPNNTYVEGFESFRVVRLCVDLVVAFVVIVVFVFFVPAGAGFVMRRPRISIDWTLKTVKRRIIAPKAAAANYRGILCERNAL